jgi:two-component system, NtrC family, response regulator GlrR
MARSNISSETEGTVANSPEREKRSRIPGRRRTDQLVGTSRAIQTALEQIAVAARGGFFSLDAAIVPAQLLAREIFGNEEGAIPALPNAHEGAFMRARGGTVLIENIEALSKDLQQQLATALERGTAERIGARESYPIECRVIAASTSSLETLTGEGALAPELSERLRLLVISIPPLRERKEDILPIASDELAIQRARIERETGQLPTVRGFAREALERELREQVRASIGLARGEELGPEDLLLSWDSSDHVPSFREAKRAFEHEYVTRVLRLCAGNISRAARIARKDRKDFYDVMRRNSINPQDFRA